MHFKNKEDYKKQRNELVNKGKELLASKSMNELEDINNKINALDEKWQEDAVELANVAALEDKFKSLSNLGGRETMEDNKVLEMDNVYSTKEYKNAWLKNLQGKTLTPDESKMFNAAIGATGAVIPTETYNMVIEKLEQTSALYNHITVTNMPNYLSIPVENVKNDAEWVEMSTAATDSEDSVTNVTLSAYKIIKTLEIGADVQAMSISAFETFIVNALYKKLYKAIEKAIISGTGTNQPTGLLKSGEITNTGTFTKAGMTYKDLMKIIGALPTGYNGTFTLQRQLFFGEILGMTTADGQRVVVADAQSPAKFNILGYPVILNDLMPADTIIFGDLSYYHFNWAKAPTVESDASTGFRTGSTVYRVLGLADGKKILADAFVKYTRASA